MIHPATKHQVRDNRIEFTVAHVVAVPHENILLNVRTRPKSASAADRRQDVDLDGLAQSHLLAQI